MARHIPDVNETAPDFTVRTASDELFQLKNALKGTHQIMLIFYRGHW